MGGDWHEVALGDLFKVKHGFAFKGEFFTDEPQPEVMVTPGNFAIGGGFQDDKRKYYRGPVPTDYVLRPGQIVVTMTDLSKQSDTLGFAARVPSDTNVWLHNQRVGLLVFNPSAEADARFVEYLLRSHEYRAWVVGSATGTTVKHTSPSRIEGFRTRVPPSDQQRAIAHILGTLDDKIELNRRRNQILEAMAHALFKDWFIDFGPVRRNAAKAQNQPSPGLRPPSPRGRGFENTAHEPLPSPPGRGAGGEGVIEGQTFDHLFPDRLDDEGKPEGWEFRPIYDFANVVYGAPFASKQFNTTGAGVPLIRIRDLVSQEPGVWTEQIHPKGHLIEPGDIVVGMDGEFRLHIWKGQPAWLNQRVSHFEPLPGIPSSFLAEALIEPLAFFERGKVGTTVIHLGKGDIDTFRAIHPGDRALEAFAHVAEPWIAETVRNALESKTLAQLRDTLLPKLISGELRIKDAEQFVEAAQ